MNSQITGKRVRSGWELNATKIVQTVWRVEALMVSRLKRSFGPRLSARLTESVDESGKEIRDASPVRPRP
jgi:hypothetical protein